MLYQVEPLPDTVIFKKNGALEGIRTPDLLVRSQTLYPAELRARIPETSLMLSLF